MNEKYFIEQEFLNSEELIDKISKTRSLNSLRLKIDKLMDRTNNNQLIAKMMSMLLLLEDAYKIDMYKFQFNIFVFSLDKEIKKI